MFLGKYQMNKPKLNLLYEKIYYCKETDISQPFPNGMHKYSVDYVNSLFKYYENNEMYYMILNNFGDIDDNLWEIKEFKDIDELYLPFVLWGYPFFTKDVCSDFDITFYDVEKEDLDENLVYVYPIELKTMEGLNFSDCVRRDGTTDIFEFEILDTISDKVINLVNKGKCKIILDFEHEGSWGPRQFNRWYEKSCMTRDIDFTNFYFLCGDLGCEDKILDKVEINIVPSKFYMDQLSRDVTDLRNDGGEMNDLGYMTYFHTIDDIDLSKKTKHFFTMLRNVSKEHRICLAAYLEYYDLWDNNRISWLKGEWEGNVPECLDEKYHPMIDKLSDKPIIEIDTQNTENKWGFPPMMTWNWDFFQETFLSIVTEAAIFESVFLTEKTSAPLWNLHPFIMIGAPFTLKKLHELKFKTFHPFIDESYDNEPDNTKRINMIFDELDKFKEKSIEELREWWKDIIPILEYNQNNFLNISKEKSTKAKLLESFYE
jgi:hypothetical protein